MKNIRYFKTFMIAIVLTATLLLTGCGGSSAWYESGKDINVKNGNGTENIGKMLLTRAKSDEVTDDTLASWYYGLVDGKDYNWAVIVYMDQNGKGVYAANGLIERDVNLIKDEYDTYALGDETETTVYYTVTDDGKTLQKLNDNN